MWVTKTNQANPTNNFKAEGKKLRNGKRKAGNYVEGGNKSWRNFGTG